MWVIMTALVAGVSDETVTVNLAAFDIEVVNTNDAPTGIALTSNSVDENEASGSAVGELSAVDEDSADTHEFSIHHEVIFETSGFNYLIKVDGEYLDGNNPEVTIIQGHTYTIKHEGSGHPVAIWNSETTMGSPLVTLSSGDSYELDTSETSIWDAIRMYLSFKYGK